MHRQGAFKYNMKVCTHLIYTKRYSIYKYENILIEMKMCYMRAWTAKRDISLFLIIIIDLTFDIFGHTLFCNRSRKKP